MFKIEDNLYQTDTRHRHMVDSYAYMMAAHYAKLHDDYLFLYIKQKPWYIPDFLYKWFISKFIIITKFK